MLTPCTICGAPCPGTPDDDAPCCDACDAANFPEAEVRPPVHVTRRCARRLAQAPWLREVLQVLEAQGDGREA